MKINKKAVSPVISTVLLIMIVMILAVIIFLWAKGLVKEAILKDIAGTEKVTNQWCSEVKLESIVNGDEFGFKNIGNVPIYKYDVKLTDNSGGSELYEVSNEDGGMVNPGFISIVGGKIYSEYEGIEIIPILLGKGEKDGGIKEFRCAESQTIPIK
jgi:flagellin-like protein